MLSRTQCGAELAPQVRSTPTLPIPHPPTLRREKTAAVPDNNAWGAALGEGWGHSVRKMLSGLQKCFLVVFFPPHHHLAPSYLGLERLCRRCVGRGRRQRLDPSCPHVGEELVGDLGQDVLGKAGHAQDVVTRPVDIIPEWDKLGEKENK